MGYNSVRSKLNRAVAAYLRGLGNDCGGAADIVPSNSVAAKGYPNTVVRSTIAKPEVMGTGTERINLWITIKGNSIDGETSRVQFDKRISATKDAMMQTGDGQSLRSTAELITAAGRALAATPDLVFNQNNSDMADFTCQAVYDDGEGDGDPEAEGAAWVEIFMFQVIACGSNTD